MQMRSLPLSPLLLIPAISVVAVVIPFPRVNNEHHGTDMQLELATLSAAARGVVVILSSNHFPL